MPLRKLLICILFILVPFIVIAEDVSPEIQWSDESRLQANKAFEAGEIDKSIKLSKANLKYVRRVLKADDVIIGVSLKNLAEILFKAEHYDESEPYLVEAIAYAKKIVGDEHPIFIEMQTLLAHVLIHQKRYEEAKAIVLPLVQLSRGMAWLDVDMVIDIKIKLAYSHYKLKAFRKAKLVIIDTLKQIHKSNIGPDSRAINLAIKYGQVLGALKEYDVSEKVLTETCKHARAVSGVGTNAISVCDMALKKVRFLKHYS